MAKIKLTVQELRRQREDLKRYRRFLPTLILKKLQIQIEVNKARRELAGKSAEETRIRDHLRQWIAVLGEEAGITEMVAVEGLVTGTTSVAGIEIPVFEGLRFKDAHYDLYTAPLWIDRALEVIKQLMTLKAEILTLQKQLHHLEQELRTTMQRVNLFEKIKIPEAVENARRIQVFLGDQQTAAVVRGKLSKLKVGQRNAVAPPEEPMRP
jgi:V/A-type H+-transporting ATPase subunit D